MKLHWMAAIPALMGGAIITVAPQAQAGPVFQSCGAYQLPAESARVNPGPHALIVRQGDGVSCGQAHGVFDDLFSGKGTRTASRNVSMVDGYQCTGSFGAEYTETGVLTYCEGNGVWFSIRKAIPGDLLQER